MKTSFQSLLFSSFVLLTIVLLSYSGMYYQTESDTVFPTYIFGYYTNGINALPITFGCFSYLGDLMNILNEFIGSNSLIYDGLQLILVLVSVWICFYKLFINQFQFSFSKLILILVFSVLLIDFFMPFEFSKTSFIITFLGFLLYFKNKKSPVSYLLITIGFLIRPEPAIIVLLINVLYFLFFNINNYSINISFSALLLYLPLLIVLLVLSLSINIPVSAEDLYYKKIRPYEYNLSDFDMKDSVTKNSNKESNIKIIAAKNFFYADSSKINKYFFDMEGIVPRDKTPFSIIKSFANFSEFFFKNSHAFNYIKKISPYLNFGVLMILVFLYFKDYRYIVFILCISALNLFLAFYFKPEFHFMTPIFCITYLLCFQKLYNYIIDLKKIQRVCIFLLLIYFGSIKIFAFQNELLDKSKRKQLFFSKILEHVEKNPNENIMLNISVWDNFHWKLFSKIQPINHDKIIVVDGGILYINGTYQNKMKHFTGEDTFEKQFLKIISKEKLQIYSSEKRMELIKEYMHIVYGVIFDIEPILSFGYFEHANDEDDIYLYEIK